MTDRPIVVVGGGVIGCFTAYFLTRLGARVVLLERDRLGSGASLGNCGYVCPSHVLPLATPGAVRQTLRAMMSRDSPIAISRTPSPSLLAWFARFATRCREAPMNEAAEARHRLLAESKRLYTEMVERGEIACDWRETGLLVVYRSGSEFERFRSVADRLRHDFEVSSTALDSSQLCQHEPTLRPGLGGGWLFKDDVQIDPAVLMGSLKSLLLGCGVDIHESCEVRRLVIEAGRLVAVDTSTGCLEVSGMVLCTGAEAPAFARMLRCTLPIQPGKGYSITKATAGPVPRTPLIFEESHVAVSPLHKALRIGSTMEFAGYNRELNAKRLGLLSRATREHLRESPDLSDADNWAGWRPMVYDGVPCIDRAPAAPNAIVAAGNGMIGLSTAPATGQLAAALATGTTPPFDATPYRVSRFGRTRRRLAG